MIDTIGVAKLDIIRKTCGQIEVCRLNLLNTEIAIGMHYLDLAHPYPQLNAKLEFSYSLIISQVGTRFLVLVFGVMTPKTCCPEL